MDEKNFKHNHVGGVDCEVDHPIYGTIPYTLGPDEVVPEGETILPADPLPPKTVEEVERTRLTEYANPVNGSDRYFAEAATARALGNEAAAVAAEQAGIARYQEIKAANPWPV